MKASKQTLVMVQATLSADPNVDRAQARRIMADLNCNPVGKLKMVSGKQAAEVIECSKYSVRRYAERGYLTPIRLSARVVRYNLAEVERFAQEGIPVEAVA